MWRSASASNDGFVGRATGTQPDNGDHFVAPPLARPAGDHAVVHVRVRLDRRLDLLGEDLLAAAS